MSAMQAGTQMVKLRGGAKGLARFYFLDEHRSCIRWRPSRKSEKAKSEWGAGPSSGPGWGSRTPSPGCVSGSGPSTGGHWPCSSEVTSAHGVGGGSGPTPSGTQPCAGCWMGCEAKRPLVQLGG